VIAVVNRVTRVVYCYARTERAAVDHATACRSAFGADAVAVHLNRRVRLGDRVPDNFGWREIEG